MTDSQTDSFDPTSRWPVLAGLQQRSQDAKDETELVFVMANETWQLVHYDQACVVLLDALGRPQLRAVSGLADALEDTPLTLWVRQVAAELMAGQDAKDMRALQATQLDAALQSGWAEWWPQHALYVPLLAPDGRLMGAVLFNRDAPWQEAELLLLKLLHATYAYVMQSWRPASRSLAQRWQRWRQQPGRLALVAAVLVAALCFPVHVSVLAPAEIIALKAEAIAAPTEGVVKTFHVQPNQSVKQGDKLLSLDDTTLRNKKEIAARSLAVARADVLAAQQKAFDSAQSRADLAMLLGRVQEKEAELAYLEETLGRIDVRAPHDGVLVYGDPNDWVGKPVVAGERIAQLAQPQPLGVQVWLPVADAISLDVGARMRVYLQVAPLSALSGALVQTSYQASPSPEGISSYRIRGQLDAGQQAHIGLRGVAKVYGGWQPAIYWMLRRPIGALRQWIGL